MSTIGKQLSDPPSLLHPGEASAGMLFAVLGFAIQEKGQELQERVQGRATKMFKSLAHLLYEKRLSNLGFFSMDKRRPRVDLIAVYKYLKCGSQVDEGKLFSVKSNSIIRGNG